MPYESTINFTLDTICPWTYLSYTRLKQAITSLSPDEKQKATFKFHFNPYLLHAETPQQGTPKAEWYKKTMFEDSEEKWERYQSAMRELGEPLGIRFRFGGEVAGTLPAHRILQFFQEEKGEEVARGLLEGLYKLYFEEEQHPSCRGTLLEACRRAGIDGKEAERVIDDEYEGLAEVKGLIREQEMNGVDAVPVVSIEGRRRDFGLQGAKSIEEYAGVLRKVIAEAG